jgi:Lon protease-like protein
MKAVRVPGRSGSANQAEGESFRKVQLGSGAFMSDYETRQTPSRSLTGFDSHGNARALVRLVQCSQCSFPFKVPVTLPCGHSVCRACLPNAHRRENISYPNTADRMLGTHCPVEGCDEEHPIGDCCVDVCLSKVMESINAVVDSYRPASENTPTRLVEVRKEDDISDTDMDEKIREHVLLGGRLLSTFSMAEMGQLDYRAEVSYESMSQTGDNYQGLDTILLQQLRETTHKELDCHVCYNLMYDPVTTPCGHTFCRKCLTRVLDHASYCPVCRRGLPIPPSLERQASNVRLVSLLINLCPELVASRAEAVAAEERGILGDMDTSLFVCTLAFPKMPTFLHIFEPRYRLMIRRAMETNRQFGMLTYNGLATPQGDLGVTSFKEHGTMLYILNVHMMPDGRSMIETRGLYRFRVRGYGTLDGYTVGKVERVEDVSLAEEERIEAEEIVAAMPPPDSPMSTVNGRVSRTSSPDRSMNLDRFSTQQLLAIGLDFIQKMRAHSAPWLHQRIIEVHGGPPDDPATFPYWFASILPIVDDEKYQLLSTKSVRERLKIVVTWIHRIETQRS